MSHKNIPPSHPVQHVARAFLVPSQLSTTSLSTLSPCLPFRPCTRPTTRPLLTSSSHGDFPCADPSNECPVADTTSPTGYEPNAKDLIEVTKTEVKPMFFHRPSMASTHDSAESFVTPPPESDLDDQVRKMLASPLYLQEREASADRPRVYHSFRENSVSSSSHFRESVGKPAAMFSHKREWSQETLSEKAFPQDIKRFKEEVKLSSGCLIRKKLRDLFLKNKEIIFSQKQNPKS